jgi:hypothetical protein
MGNELPPPKRTDTLQQRNVARKISPCLFDGSDPIKSDRAMAAMLQMKKLDAKSLEQAYAG